MAFIGDTTKNLRMFYLELAARGNPHGINGPIFHSGVCGGANRNGPLFSGQWDETTRFPVAPGMNEEEEEEENINSLLVPAPQNPPRAKLYKSKHHWNKPPTGSTLLLKNTTMTKSANPAGDGTGLTPKRHCDVSKKTMGAVKTKVDPKCFIKKRAGVVDLPSVRKFSWNDTHVKRPPVPRRSEKPLMGVISKKDFVHENATMNISRKPPRNPSKKPCATHASNELVDFRKKKDYGRIPHYLMRRADFLRRHGISDPRASFNTVPSRPQSARSNPRTPQKGLDGGSQSGMTRRRSTGNVGSPMRSGVTQSKRESSLTRSRGFRPQSAGAPKIFDSSGGFSDDFRDRIEQGRPLSARVVRNARDLSASGTQALKNKLEKEMAYGNVENDAQSHGSQSVGGGVSSGTGVTRDFSTIPSTIIRNNAFLQQGNLKLLSQRKKEKLLRGLKEKWEIANEEYMKRSTLCHLQALNYGVAGWVTMANEKENLEYRLNNITRDIEKLERKKYIFVEAD